MNTAWKDEMAGGFPAGSSTAPPSRVDPLFFPNGEHSLFACYHPPRAQPTGLGVVLLSSLGHESIQFHRVFRQLGYLLADAGVAVLRFDYTGCGDSTGDDSDWSLEQWRTDVRAAIHDLRRRSQAQRIGLIGLRVGGSLAVQVGAGDEDLDHVVLWDPVVKGTDHLRELDQQHESMLRYAHVQPRTPERGPVREVLGFAIPESLSQDIEALNLLDVEAAPARRTLLVETNPNLSQNELARHLARHPEFQHESFDNPHLWVWIEDFAKVHVPHQILRRIVSWCTETGS